MGKGDVANLPNSVTMGRVALVPVVLVALVLDAGGRDGGAGPGVWRWVAVAAFVLAASTDRLDGWLARRLDKVTDFGKLVDPIADKLLVGGTLVALSAIGDLPWWVTVVILVRELGITAMRFAVLRYVVIPASRGGKLKTVLQSVAITLFLLPLASLPVFVTVVAWVVVVAAVVVTVLTGADYLWQGRKVSRAARGAAATGGRP